MLLRIITLMAFVAVQISAVDSTYFAVDANTVALWRFNEGEGDTAHDISGNNNHGKLVNGPTWCEGRFGHGIQLDGIDDYIEIAHNSSQSGMSQLSIEAHVYITDTPSQTGTIIDKHGSGSYEDDCYTLEIENTNKAFGLIADGTSSGNIKITS
ncbi:MAG: hypothetical protein PHN57_08550, partial [Candidatus Omnitrophica bacterium]|nr:hypothetical protein [Candidatus Omnitrophota bacterium]